MDVVTEFLLLNVKIMILNEPFHIRSFKFNSNVRDILNKCFLLIHYVLFFKENLTIDAFFQFLLIFLTPLSFSYLLIEIYVMLNCKLF